MEKRIFNSILRRLRRGGVRITYWDGDTYTYGTAKPYFHMHVKNPKAIRAILKNINNNLMVTSPGRTWKQFWDSMERMSDRLEALGIDDEIEGRNV